MSHKMEIIFFLLLMETLKEDSAHLKKQKNEQKTTIDKKKLGGH